MAEVNYTLLVKEDKTYITNNENLPVQWNLFEGGTCKPETSIGAGEIAPSETWEVPLTQDGKYRVLLTSTEFINTQSNIYIDYFLNLQKSMIEDIFTALCPCDCGCAACEDLSSDQYQQLLTTRSKMDVYIYATSPRYDAALKEVRKGTICLVSPQIYCDIATEGVTGESVYSEKLTKQLIALDYLAMYFWELRGVTDPEQIEYINEKYKSEEILCCISALGIDINSIKQIIEDMAQGEIDSLAYTNLPPNAVGPFSIQNPNRGTHVFIIADFTQPPFDPALPNPNNLPNNQLHTVRILGEGGTAPQGELQILGVHQTVFPFEVLATAIDNGDFTYVSPDVDAIDDDTVDFEISNVGAPTLFTA